MVHCEEVLEELAADRDSDDNFDGDWCDSDGNLNLHDDDVGCVSDIKSLLLRVGVSSDSGLSGDRGVTETVVESLEARRETLSESESDSGVDAVETACECERW